MFYVLKRRRVSRRTTSDVFPIASLPPDVMQMIHNRMNNVSTGRLATVTRATRNLLRSVQSKRHLKVFRITNRTKIPKWVRAYSDEPIDQAMLRVHHLSTFSTVTDPLMVNAHNRIRRLVKSGSKVTPSMIQRYITVALKRNKVPQKESNAILRGMMEQAKPTNSATIGVRNVNTLRHLHTLRIPIGGEAFKHDFLSFLTKGQRSRYYATFMYRLMQDPSAGFNNITECLRNLYNEAFPYFAHFLFEGVTHLTPAVATASNGSKFNFLSAYVHSESFGVQLATGNCPLGNLKSTWLVVCADPTTGHQRRPSRDPITLESAWTRHRIICQFGCVPGFDEVSWQFL